MTTKTLAFLGTGSDVGKSVIATGFCRMLSDLGHRVAPYKAQNMSNNSYVTVDGGEMGRAQVVQAQAARVEPHVDMNPVLIKPTADSRSQVVVQGRVWEDVSARTYCERSAYCRQKAYESLDRLMGSYEAVCLEGAGSCAEMNLRQTDFVNFQAARRANAPVILVGDIDRGGVFAQLLGTLDLLDSADRALVKGLIVNKFRGDRELFDDGVAFLERRSGLPVVGVVPYYHGIAIDEEDAVCLDRDACMSSDTKARIAVIRLPHISNFTDFAALGDLPGVEVRYVTRLVELSTYDCVIVPGTKNVRGDLAWLRHMGWEEAIRSYEGRIAGICGGYQMLGKRICDPYGVEGEAGESAGLGLLDCVSVLGKAKRLTRVRGWVPMFEATVAGYEIHVGRTFGGDEGRVFARIRVEGDSVDMDDGWMEDCGRVFGTYIHGLLDAPSCSAAFVEWATAGAVKREDVGTASKGSRDTEYGKLAAHLADHIDMERCLAILDGGVEAPRPRRCVGPPSTAV